jgi:hypothetical protein
MIRFETRPARAGDVQVVWGPWRKPTKIISFMATYINGASAAPQRLPRLTIQNVSQILQMFGPAGQSAYVDGTASEWIIAAYNNPGPSHTRTPAGVLANNPFVTIAIPEPTIIEPGNVLTLSMADAQSDDAIADIVLAVEDLPSFRE